jgi:hypothetical protein
MITDAQSSTHDAALVALGTALAGADATCAWRRRLRKDSTGFRKSWKLGPATDPPGAGPYASRSFAICALIVRRSSRELRQRLYDIERHFGL